jgi:hypothetical protein
MTTAPFTLILTPENRLGYFMLVGGTITYPVEFYFEADVVLPNLLHNFHYGHTSEEMLTPHLVMQEIGIKLWQALMPIPLL